MSYPIASEWSARPMQLPAGVKTDAATSFHFATPGVSTAEVVSTSPQQQPLWDGWGGTGRWARGPSLMACHLAFMASSTAGTMRALSKW